MGQMTLHIQCFMKYHWTSTWICIPLHAFARRERREGVHPMNTKSDAFQQQHSDPAKVQCPRCGAYTPKQTMSYRNPQTGEQVADDALVLAMVICVCIFFVVVLGGNGLLYLLGAYKGDPANAEFGCIFIPIALFCVIAAAPIYVAWRRKSLSKRFVTVRRFVCWNCNNEWTVTQEPPAKELS
jgi:hypothetical protein